MRAEIDIKTDVITTTNKLIELYTELFSGELDGEELKKHDQAGHWLLVMKERIQGREPKLKGGGLKPINKDLQDALEEAKVFAEWVELLSKPDVEVYKSEMSHCASLSISRIEKALAGGESC